MPWPVNRAQNLLLMKRPQAKLDAMARPVVGKVVQLSDRHPMADAPSGLPQFVPPTAHSMVGNVAGMREFLKHLRTVRDSQSFKADGAHNFREWAMKQFGDKIGIWLDETL